jgi:hypothetical protein
MFNRYRNALQLSNGGDIAELCEAISAAQREIYDDKKGSDDVKSDPAVRLMAAQLVSHFKADELDTVAGLYGNLSDQCESARKTGSRAHGDGIDSQSAVNTGALALSIARHAKVVEAPEDHPGLRLIAYQISYLCKVQSMPAPSLQGLKEICRAEAAIQMVPDRSAPAQSTQTTPNRM